MTNSDCEEAKKLTRQTKNEEGEWNKGRNKSLDVKDKDRNCLGRLKGHQLICGTGGIDGNCLGRISLGVVSAVHHGEGY